MTEQEVGAEIDQMFNLVNCWNDVAAVLHPSPQVWLAALALMIASRTKIMDAGAMQENQRFDSHLLDLVRNARLQLCGGPVMGTA